MSIKEGYLKKWSPSKNRWLDVYAKLLHSGWFQWFEDQTSQSPKRSIDIRSVSKFLAFGDILANVPMKPPGLTETEYKMAFGVPHESHPRTKVSFFICPTPAEMESWQREMCSLLYAGYQPPPPAGPPMQPGTQQPPYPTNVGFSGPGPSAYNQPPPAYAPPPYAPAPQSSYPTQPAYNPHAGASYPRQAPPAPGTYQQYGGQPPVAGQQFTGPNGQPYQIVYVDGKPRKKKLGGMKNAAVGLAGGLAGGYLASRMFGGWGWGGPMMGGGFGRWGSWSSLSSFSWSD